MFVALFDPSIASGNIGDEIIIDSVIQEIADLLPNHQTIRIPTQEVISKISREIAGRAAVRLVGGTNLLTSRMREYRQWQVGVLDALKLRDVVLCGVGWWQYQTDPDKYTAYILKRILSRTGIHSVRDEYTKKKLESIGVRNVVNTGCPTMWRLTADRCAGISSEKADRVLFTLTDYSRSENEDLAMIELLQKCYAKVFFWPQGSRDMDYLSCLGVKGTELVRPSLSSYDLLLESEAIDFVGTRLHGGVRALQKNRRALILAVDNRTKEIALDTGLEVRKRGDIAAVEEWVKGGRSPSIRMNRVSINLWKQQFLK